MLPKSWFQPSPKDTAAMRLLERVCQAARDPDLYGPGKLPDTMDGRFEAIVLMASVLLTRLKNEPRAEKAAQAFTDRLFRHLDAGLRESGVGDLTVPKKMKALAASFYGRLSAYGAPLEEADASRLGEALARNVWADEGPEGATAFLAARALGLHKSLACVALELLETEAPWICDERAAG